MISNKLDVDRGCNENLYGDKGTHTNMHADTQLHTHMRRQVHACTKAVLMKESVIIACPRHTYIPKYIHPTLQRERSSK